MKKVTMIKIENCPYCLNALKAIEEIKGDEAYASIDLEIIDENKEQDKAMRYANQYYYVPTLFVADEKIYEASPRDDYATIKVAVLKAFDKAKA